MFDDCAFRNVLFNHWIEYVTKLSGQHCAVYILSNISLHWSNYQEAVQVDHYPGDGLNLYVSVHNPSVCNYKHMSKLSTGSDPDF